MIQSTNLSESKSTKKFKDSYPRVEKYKTGQRYYNYILIGEKAYKYDNFEKGCNSWECLCDCGKVFITSTRQIHRGRKSCGCLRLTSQFRKKDDQIESNHHLYIKRYKINAFKRNIEWNLTDTEALSFFLSDCYYCNAKPSRCVATLKKCPKVIVNGIDRKNNKEEYNISNCVSCCTICNRAKSDMDFGEFLRWIKRIKLRLEETREFQDEENAKPVRIII